MIVTLRPETNRRNWPEQRPNQPRPLLFKYVLRRDDFKDGENGLELSSTLNTEDIALASQKLSNFHNLTL